jgi:prepilin peptidase CpaA
VPALTDLAGRLGPHEVVALVVSAGACITDLRTRRIPNYLTLGGALAAMFYAVAVHGLSGLGLSLAGWGAGLIVFLPVFLLGGLGAGDVKLVACLGAWLGPTLALWTALYGAVAGGIMALIVALATGYLRTAVDNVYQLAMHFRIVGIKPHPELTLERGRGPRLPYAVPIAAGMVAALWLH